MSGTQVSNTLSFDQLLDNWHLRIRRAQIGHYRTAVNLNRLHYLVGTLSIVISGMVGSSAFTSLRDIQESQPNPKIRIAIGFASVTAAILTGLQTFLQFSQRVEQHRTASIKYGSLRQEIEIRQQLGSDSSDLTNKEFIQTINGKWEHLNEESPTLPNRILKEVLREFPNRQA